ncbi:TonB-dependent receptor [Parabacteroides sp. Marseille-P3160]|uniref:TonB-dependent receptor n=1 Tax=Parabacteroides sp. Marseille-P3160 TaxID=1917887 RepID=UPI00135677B4|nr:TonB-dependent receptor [Parabacteroides sp. Marseille-P3160]
MKIATLLLIISFSQIVASTYAQKTMLNVHVKNGTLENVIKQIEDQSEFLFFYGLDDVDNHRQISINKHNCSIEEILNEISDDTGLKYTIKDRHIILSGQMREKVSPERAVISGIEQSKRKVTGVVVDAFGEPVLGANVQIKGTTQGTITGLDGKFSLDASEGDIMIVSFVGYLSQQFVLSQKWNFEITLKEDTQVLDDVVVVGYGVQKKVNLTGSVSSISSQDLIKRQVGQSSMLLQGIAPGVTVTQSSGQPGKDGGSIRVRGVGTLNNANPLILVDGVEMSIDNVDPNLIESISVLKDAASSAIYGSRAANGVVLVTTKRAKEGEFSVSLNSYAGWQERTNVRKPVNAIEHMTMLNEAYTNVGSQPLYSEEYIETYKQNMVTDPDNYPNLNWQDELYTGSGFQNNHFLTINGGTQKMRVLAGLGYYSQDGLIENTDYKRYTARFNTDMTLSDRLSMKFDIYLRHMETKEPGAGIDEIIYWANRMPATQPNRLSTGLRGIGWDGDNPSAMAEEGGFRKEQKPSVAATGGLNFKITDFLNFDVNYSLHYVQILNSVFNPIIKTYYPNSTLAYEKPNIASLTETRTSTLNKDLKLLLNFNKTWGRHNLVALAGFSQEDYGDDAISGYRDNFTFPQYTVLNAGSKENQKASGSGTQWILQSYFGRVNYDFASKYLFEANVRYDGSSRFAKGHRWGIFPSFSAGWRISEEAFWDNLRESVQNLKVRASWGELGNQFNLIGNYPFASFVSYNTYALGGVATSGAAIDNMGNSLISWETTRTFDLGLDLTFLQNRLNVTADYYIKKTSDILMTLDIPKTVGLVAPVQNAGEVENKGWELSASFQDHIADFRYNVGFTLSDVKNKILDMKGVKKTGLTVNNEGYSINSLYGYRAIGYITEDDFDANGTYTGPAQFGKIAPGDIKYLNLNGDNVINAEDQEIIGSTIPRYTYGVNLGMEYKGFDLSMFWQGVGKADGYLNQQATMPFYWGGTAMEMHKDHWTPTNQNAAFPRFAFNQTNNEQNSTFWLKDASYLRLKNMQIGYTLPVSIIKKMHLKYLRFYVSGQNLLTFDHFWDGYDVEAPIGRGSFYPQVKLYTIGVDIKF